MANKPYVYATREELESRICKLNIGIEELNRQKGVTEREIKQRGFGNKHLHPEWTLDELNVHRIDLDKQLREARKERRELEAQHRERFNFKLWDDDYVAS